MRCAALPRKSADIQSAELNGGGTQFTTKLEGMFKDVDTSRDVTTAFRATPAARRVPAGVEIAVSILTAGCDSRACLRPASLHRPC